MVRRIKAKLVLRLRDQGLSRNAIAMGYGMSKHSVIDVFDAAARFGVSYGDVEERSDDEVYAMLFPGRGVVESVYGQPDWEHVHRELGRVGVTLRLLHAEYVDACRTGRMPFMGYDRFCKLYADHVRRLGVTSRVEREAGRTVEVDWPVRPCPSTTWPPARSRRRTCLSVARRSAVTRSCARPATCPNPRGSTATCACSGNSARFRPGSCATTSKPGSSAIPGTARSY